MTATYKDRIAARKSRLRGSSAAGAAVALGAIGSTAQAAIVTQTYNLAATGSPGFSVFLRFNPLTGASEAGSQSTNATYPLGNGTSFSTMFSRLDQSLADWANNPKISYGTDVSTLDFSASSPNTYDLTPFGTYYTGFKMVNQGAGNDETYFGFAEYVSSTGNNFTLVSTSINTTDGAPIEAGIVPEPSTYALSFGAVILAGFVLYKRYKGRIASLLPGA